MAGAVIIPIERRRYVAVLMKVRYLLLKEGPCKGAPGEWLDVLDAVEDVLGLPRSIPEEEF
jgi:hypothetical protein